MVGVGVVEAFEKSFVEQLHRKSGREVGVVPVVGRTDEGCLLKTAATVQSAVVFDVSGERRIFPKIELARNLCVGTFGEFPAEINIDEVEPRTPFIGLEMLDGHGYFLAIAFFVGIDVASEIVVQLNVLRLCSR